MVARYNSISTRKLSNALKILTSDKSIVAMSDYNDFYKEAKRHLLTSTLGPNAQVCYATHSQWSMNMASFYNKLLTPGYICIDLLCQFNQKRHCIHREVMIKNVCEQFHAHLESHPTEALNFRKSFQSELFGLSVKEVSVNNCHFCKICLKVETLNHIDSFFLLL